MNVSTTQRYVYPMTTDPKTGAKPTSLGGLVANYRKNFLEKEIEIVSGLRVSQYEIVKGIYFALHNQFQSGATDENGDPKYWYDLMTDRNDQATKNIDLDTKDCYIKSETGGSMLKSWMLRREFMGYAKSSGFGMKLNTLSDDLPDFGTVVWKKVKYEGRTDVCQVELINIINDPRAKCLKDGLMVERHLLTQSELYDYKSWDKNAVENLVKRGGQVSPQQFMDANGTAAGSNISSRIDETTPYYEVFEVWGQIPRTLYEQSKKGGLLKVGPSQEAKTVSSEKSINPNEMVYVMAIVAGINPGESESVLFCKEVDKDLFPYKEVHYRRRKGRWLGLGNYELCFPLIEKANELTNRFFASLRIALLHIYQTRDKLHVKNVLQDLLDGDVVVSKSELTALPTEIRGFTQYKEELDRIEQKADRLCNSFEIVTGENLPAGTPFQLGAQMLKSATKLFEYVQENMGMFIESVFNEWLLPDFAASLTHEHILELMDDLEDIEIYYNARRKMFQYEVVKQYILETNKEPSIEQIQLVGELVKDQIKKGPKQLKIERDYYANQKYSIKVVITGENDAKKENLETVSSLTQVAMANPQGLQDPRLMKLVNIVLEQSGYSPLEINAVNETPTNSLLNPAMQGGNGAARPGPGQAPSNTATSPPGQAGGGGQPVR